MNAAAVERGNQDPGVPEGLPRALLHLRSRLGVETLDRLWIFPPIRRGRKESGLVAAGFRTDDEDRRRLVTVSYVAERTGVALVVEPTITPEGDAPPEAFPRIMLGVVRRLGDEGKGEPREVEIDGSDEAFTRLMEEFDSALLGVAEP
ncbi:MAG: hypothetical protein OEZ65_08805 [Gemmatimonadota bacterium]|nr:hypothetical protein [Gemmatimonadota bacterium]MDH5759673.1 hypothetical protein [Gemmatimonadota bacterium]